MQKLDPEMKTLFEQIGIEQSQVDEETIDFIYDFVEKQGGIDALRKEMAQQKCSKHHVCCTLYLYIILFYVFRCFDFFPVIYFH